jgi:hypothetical protein
VKDHYGKLGFAAENDQWVMRTTDYVERKTHIALALEVGDHTSHAAGV